LTGNQRVGNLWRLTGLLPILFFALKVWQYAPAGQAAQLLWFCNISNLVLGLAIFAAEWRRDFRHDRAAAYRAADLAL
jgi:hypothetical protein